MVFLCQCQYYHNINYYDLLGSILSCHISKESFWTKFRLINEIS